MGIAEAPSRRHALRLILGSCGAAALGSGTTVRTATARAAGPFPNGATVLVAGTQGGPLDRWAGVLLPGLARALPPHTRITKETAIGGDGVTGANQFTARAVPDGTTALLVPGAAAIAWLVGDPRVHFDTASWVPAMAAVAPAVVVGKVPLSALGPDQSPRIAAAGPAGPDLPALLSLELLGSSFTTVFGLGDPNRAREALRDGAVDLVFLYGEDVPERANSLASEGATPLFSLGTVDAAGRRTRDPLMPNIPSLEEVSLNLFGRPLHGPLVPAWNAAAAATMLDYALVLPTLTTPDVVGLWRSMSQRVAGETTVRALAGAAAVRIETAPAASRSISTVAADAAALLELRQWLASRFAWRPA
jgi:hypothetical protein